MTAAANSLGPGERRTLLVIARRSIEAALQGIAEVPALAAGAPVSYGGVFVSLHDAGGLRGCIGSLEGTLPLGAAVWETARKAAMRDPRFEPLTVHELPRIRLEISVLGALEPAPAESVVVGTHGVWLVHGRRSALLLPQVATEFGWGRDRFLDAVCLKAGLAPGTWRDPRVDLRRFTAEIFSELSEHT